MMSAFRKRNKGFNGRSAIAASNEHDVQDESVRTALMFHGDCDITKQEEYVYRFHHQKLPALKPNQISISGVKLTREEEDVIIVAFIRNSLENAIRFEIVDIMIVDQNGSVLAKKAFDLSSLGEIPALSSIAWRFSFEERDILAQSIPDEEWQVAFGWK
ncbi:SLAP domain-containing protein [Peribacillus muralis]|uniref:SLAP domain-containing protein n=1 Tax=Peribacillus muralis TaxID=264697 RepID=UPI003D020D97